MIEHTCGSVVPATVEAFVRHLAACTETDVGVAIVADGIVSRVDEVAALDETEPVSADVSSAVSRDGGKTPPPFPDMTDAEMASRKTAGASLRDIAPLVGVAPETVRRRIKRHEAGGES